MNKNKFSIFMILICIVTSLFLIRSIFLYNGIQLILKIITVTILIIINILMYFILFYRDQGKYRKLFAILFCCFNLGVSLFLSNIYMYANGLNKKTITYSMSLIALKGNFGSIDDISNAKIGIIKSNESSYNDSYSEFIDKYNLDSNNEIVYYDNIPLMISDLYNKVIDCSILDSDYQNILNDMEDFNDIKNEIVSVGEEIITVKKDNNFTKSTGKNLSDSFTILLMGVDSEKDGFISESSNGDSLILISFNPKTLNATMVSIPRDSYVPITCFKNSRENKITHASWYGTSCMIDTISNFLDIDIDYYIKINFKGVVSLIDSLGGVYVDVPKKLCTDDSSRTNTVCIEGGYQLLNGEQALVLARNRYDLKNGDFGRMENQQLLLMSLIERVKKVNSINEIISTLDIVSKNMDTNMDADKILSLFDIFKDILKTSKYNDTPISIQKLQLVGDAQTIYDEISKINHWNYILNNNSINDVSNAIKYNLSNSNLIKDFSYDENNNYESKIVGKGPYKNNNLYTLLPNFIGKDKSEVEIFANKYDINVVYKYEKDNSSQYKNNSVIYQSHNEKTRIDKIDTLNITLLEKNNSVVDNYSKLPNLIGMNIEDAKKLLNNYGIYDIIINEINGSFYPGLKTNTIVSQSYVEGTITSTIKKIELSIVVY